MNEHIQNRRLLVVGHADGDGYLASEQSRRNALSCGATSCDIFIDPRITSGYRFWDRHLEEFDMGDADTVVFVDLMLNYKSPRDSFERICARATSDPDRHFIYIDHHPISDLPAAPGNLEIRFSEIVYQCCLGDPSELMLIASICDRDEAPVRDHIEDLHRLRAVGVSRAAADRRGLAGAPLQQLLREDRWDILDALGQEDREFHRIVRGARSSKSPSSPSLEAARYAFA